MNLLDIDRFIRDKRLNNIISSDNTERAYRTEITAWYNHSQGKDDLESAKAYLKSLSDAGHPSKSIKRSLYILKTFYDWFGGDSGSFFEKLVKSYQVNRREGFLKQMERDERVYTNEDVKALLKEAERIANSQDATKPEYYLAYRNWFIILMMSEYGMRISGLMGCDVDHVNFDKRILMIYDSKNGEPYPVPIKDHVLTVKRYLTVRNTLMFGSQGVRTGENALFLSSTGKRLSDTSARRAVNEIAEAAGLYDTGRSTHQLRHYRATRYYREGMPMDLISQVMGVSVPVLKRTYFHLTDDDTVRQYESWLENRDRKKKVQAFRCPICGYSTDEEKQSQKPKLEVIK